MAGNRSQPYLRLDIGESLPTAADEMRGQIRLDPSSGAGDPDQLVGVLMRTDGTIAYVNLGGVAIQVGDAGTISGVNTIDFNADDFVATESPITEANVALLGNIQATLGPFFLNDVPGTAVTGMTLEFFNTAAATGIGVTGAYYAPADGRIVGAFLNSDASRSAGSAVLRPTVNGTGAVLGAGNPTLDATNTLRHSVLVTWANGIAFTAGQRISCELVTSGWTPITANVTALLLIRMDV